MNFSLYYKGKRFKTFSETVMHFSVIQRYTFYKLNFEIEILSLRYSFKPQFIFETLDFQAPHGNKTFLHVMVEQIVDIRKITLHYHRTNVRYELL